MNEITFFIEQAEEGGFTARAINDSIFTEADNFIVLKHNIREAVATHFDVAQAPILIRLQFGQVRTSSLLGYLVAIYAWLLEASVVLLHIFTKQKLEVIGHAALLVASILFTAFAWHRRQDFYALRASGGRIPLTRYQILIVSFFVMALGGLMTWISVRLFGL